MLLAAMTPCDPRTAARAIREGADAIRSRYVRSRLVAAAAELGIQLGTGGPSDRGHDA